MCDILIKDHNGFIDVYEIKLNKTINDAILSDLAIQYYVCKKRFGSRLRSFNLVLRDDENNGIITNVTKDLEPKMGHISNKIVEYTQVLAHKEPRIVMSSHCSNPYKCEFMEYCKNIKPI
jgi:hypothetical protein